MKTDDVGVSVAQDDAQQSQLAPCCIQWSVDGVNRPIATSAYVRRGLAGLDKSAGPNKYANVARHACHSQKDASEKPEDEKALHV